LLQQQKKYNPGGAAKNSVAHWANASMYLFCPHQLPQSFFVFFTSEDGVYGSSSKITDIFSVQAEVLSDESVFVRERTAEYSYIVRLFVQHIQVPTKQ
jgi:hypothetical protein